MAASPNFPKLPENWSEEFLSVQDQQVFVRLYRSKNLNQGRLFFLVHGQSEQSDRYEHFPHYLNGVVDTIACVDLPGHGKSSGVRGHIENFDAYQTAVLEAFHASEKWMRQQTGLCKAHWFGHSLGGLLTLRVLENVENLNLQSVTVSAPLLELAMPVPFLKSLFGRLIEPLFGSLRLGNELNGDMISSDPSVGQEALRNPLNHQSVTPRFFVNLMKEMPLVRSFDGSFSYPILFVVPLADQIVSWKATYAFFSKLKMKAGKSKILASFPQFSHEAFNEIGKERAFNALADWLLQNSK